VKGRGDRGMGDRKGEVEGVKETAIVVALSDEPQPCDTQYLLTYNTRQIGGE